ncbi:MAG: hypothetical protein ABW046_07625 [Actinoplanes sp.]
MSSAAGDAPAGRGWLVDLVRDWRDEPAGARWFVLTGPSGSGKTMISRHLADGSPAGPWTFAHFADRRKDGSSTSLRGFTRRLAVVLVDALPGFGSALARSVSPTNIYLNQVIEHNEGAVYGLFAQNLHVRHAPLEDLFQDLIVAPLTDWAARFPGRPLHLLVDGVDETVQDDGRSLATLLAGLPADPAPKIFLATKPDPAVLNVLSQDSRRVALDQPPFRKLHLADLREYVELHSAGSSRQAVADIVARAAGNFLVAETILAHRVDGIDLPGQSFAPLGLTAMYGQQIARLAHRLDRGGRTAAVDLLGILAVGRRPLSSASLSRLTGEPPERTVERLGAFRALLTVEVTGKQPTYALHHASLSEFLQSELIGDDVMPNQFFTPSANAHRRFRRAFEAFLSSDDPDIPPDLADYLREHGIWHTLEHARSVSKPDCRLLATALPDLVKVARSADRPLSTDSLELVLRFGSDNADPKTFERVLAACAAHPVEAATPLAADALAHWTAARDDDLILRVLAGRSEVRATVGVDAALRLRTPAKLLDAMSTSAAPDVSELGAYALFLRWSGDSRAAVEGLIDDLARKVSWRQPWQSRRRLAFLADISILLYTHNVEDRDLIDWGDRLWHRLVVERLGVDKLSRGRAARALAAVAASTLSRRLASATLFAHVVDPRQHFRSPAARALMVEAGDVLAAGSLSHRHGVLVSLFDSGMIMHRAIGALLVAGLTNQPGYDGPDPRRQLFAEGDGRRRLWILLSFAVLFEPRSRPADPVRAMTETLMRENADVVVAEDDGTLHDFPVYLLPLGLLCGRGLTPPSALTDLVGTAAARDETEHRVLTNRLIESVGFVGFYYPSVAFSALEQFMAVRDAEHTPALVRALGRMYVLHPEQVRGFLETWGAGELGPALLRGWNLGSVKRSMEQIGFFNNAAAQVALFPVMRTELVEPCLRLLGESPTLPAFIRRYAVLLLASLQRHQFHLARWTAR